MVEIKRKTFKVSIVQSHVTWGAGTPEKKIPEHVESL